MGKIPLTFEGDWFLPPWDSQHVEMLWSTCLQPIWVHVSHEGRDQLLHYANSTSYNSGMKQSSKNNREMSEIEPQLPDPVFRVYFDIFCKERKTKKQTLKENMEL